MLFVVGRRSLGVLRRLLLQLLAQVHQLIDQRIGEGSRTGRELGIRTAGATRAYGSVTWALYVTSDISHSRIVKTLSLEFFPEHMFNAPETSRRHRSFGCALRRIDRAGSLGIQSHFRRG